MVKLYLAVVSFFLFLAEFQYYACTKVFPSGSVEDRHIVGDISYAPTTEKEEFKVSVTYLSHIDILKMIKKDYWAIDIDSISVGDYTATYEKKIAAMVDTGIYETNELGITILINTFMQGLRLYSYQGKSSAMYSMGSKGFVETFQANISFLVILQIYPIFR